jgi:putative hydrolase
MVDWSLARQVARFAAGSAPDARLQADLVALSAEMEPHVAGYTRLDPEGDLPKAEMLDRTEWAEMNLDALSHLLDPVGERLEDRLAFAGPLAGALRLGARATLAAEAGLVIGYVSQRVLGQYELALLTPDVAPRLVFVEPNLALAVRKLEVDPESFYGWIVLHELTHAFQF